MNNYNQVFENNRQWVANRTSSDNSFFEKLSKGQQPGFLYIGCVDSRVDPIEITGALPGEMLVHRNVANLLDPSDPNAMSVIQFAVSTLQVKHIVVCGHYKCGGIEAAMQDTLDGPLGIWLQQIRDLAGKYRDELEEIEDLDGRFRRLTEMNVLEQCKKLSNLPLVRESSRATGFPLVHGWVFDLHSGKLIDLDFQLSD